MIKALRPTSVLWGLLLAFHFSTPLVLSRWHADIPDEDAYQNLARNLATRGTYALDFAAFHHRPFEPNSYYGPGWPAALALGYALFGGPTGFWVVLGLSWCLALECTRRLALALGLPPLSVWVLLLWMTTNPFYLYYHAHLMTEPLTVALGALLLALGVGFVERPGWLPAVLLGVISGLAHLTRTTLLLPLLAVLVVAARWVPARRLWPLVLALAAVHLAVISPWLVRMSRIGAGSHSTELKLGSNLFIYNNVNVINPYDLRPGESYGEPEGLEALTPAGRDAKLLGLAVRGIVARPGHYLKNCLRRAYYLLSPLPNFTAASRGKALVMALATAVYVWAFWGLLAAAIGKGAGLGRGPQVLLIALVLWYAFHILIHASVRQRLPSDLWLSALALSAWSSRPRRSAVEPVGV